MSRLIDADVLKGKVTSVGIVDAHGNYYGAADVVFAEDIDAAPTVNTGWISIKDKSPKDNERVLIYRPDKEKFTISIAHGWAINHPPERGVTHWMPLPTFPTAQSCE